MSVQSVRPTAVGLPVTTSSQAQPTQVPRPAAQSRRLRSSENENVFSPPGVMSRLTRSMRSEELMRVEAISRGSELAATKGYPSDTVIQAVASHLVGN